MEQAAKLKESVRAMLESSGTKPLEQLELIDALQRLGLSRHFTHEINNILASMHVHIDKHQNNGSSLYETALLFRLLRQEGFQIAQEIFKSFMTEEGSFDVKLCGDIKGVLSLYEASYLSMEDEDVLEKAKDFSIHHLKQALRQQELIDEKLGEQISHALEMPFHWRMQRLESRWFIDVYEKTENNNSIVLQLAKLDFNIVQALHLDELKQLSRWHENINLAEKLGFARSRFAEAFLWAVGLSYEPQFAYLRKVTTKAAELITVTDDVYDAYATLAEVEILTDAIHRWDINAIEELPDNINLKICFLALLNSGNEMVYEVLQEKGVNILPYVQKHWGNLCKSYLVEARWYHSGQKPSLHEYLENAVVSVSGPLNIMQAYVSMSDTIKMEDLQLLLQYPAITRHPSLILRLTDDLGTSADEMARGDVPKSIQCYMKDTGCCEEDARKYMCEMIEATWKKINKDILMDTQLKFSNDFITTAMNVARIGQCFYQYGDGHGCPDGITKQRIISLFFQPIPLPFNT
ncbi:PREDICTED: (-)-alpha-terpineol synthase-like [Ipomoea nil]|uniref:(-)-alpha-terpineol synthase-like n=1 Tax=Ipomoea nil TaxID=35883 RepID=UPI000900AE93|nr:PREDICTED: (-)-alpha-terpineol synthase-like [Ipomoea nil]